MKAQKAKPHRAIEPIHTLVVEVTTVKSSYYIGKTEGDGSDWHDDEAILELTGKIVECDVGANHVGLDFEATLITARRFGEDAAGHGVGKPNLYGVALKKDQRDLLAYMPADAFWFLAQSFRERGLTRLEIRCGPLVRGRGEVRSLHFE